MNPFVQECFPNFEPSHHREVYRELQAKPYKRILEAIVRFGPIQILERISRLLLGKYLGRKAARESESDVLLEPRRLKLHLHSHKLTVLSKTYRAGSGN